MAKNFTKIEGGCSISFYLLASPFFVKEIIDFVVVNNCFEQQCPRLGKSASPSSRFGTFLRVRAHLSGPESVVGAKQALLFCGKINSNFENSGSNLDMENL